jgi:hypothetical protein
MLTQEGLEFKCNGYVLNIRAQSKQPHKRTQILELWQRQLWKRMSDSRLDREPHNKPLPSFQIIC